MKTPDWVEDDNLVMVEASDLEALEEDMHLSAMMAKACLLGLYIRRMMHDDGTKSAV